MEQARCHAQLRCEVGPERRRSSGPRRRQCRSVAQLARAAVSKTAGRGFESSHSCQVCAGRSAEVVELVDTRS